MTSETMKKEEEEEVSRAEGTVEPASEEQKQVMFDSVQCMKKRSVVRCA